MNYLQLMVHYIIIWLPVLTKMITLVGTGSVVISDLDLQSHGCVILIWKPYLPDYAGHQMLSTVLDGCIQQEQKIFE